MINLINDECLGGIIIIPLNFISSVRKSDIDLRKKFINKYSIKIINIFEEQVFDDTTYTICSLYFTKKEINNLTTINIYPNFKTFTIEFKNYNNYTIGGEIYNLPINNDYKISRATNKNKNNITNILLKCIDDNQNSKLGFKVVENDKIFIDNTPNLSARSYATLCINKNLTLDNQKILVQKMNNYINNLREKYNSLFLTNYRESNTIARKRISFDLAFNICNYILTNHFE